MTQEGQGPSPEEAYTPPTSTRWSEEPVEDEPGIAPPFVPGRAAPEPDEAAAEGIPEGLEVQGQDSVAPPETEPDAVEPIEAPVEPEELAEGSGLPAAATGEAFPFDQFSGESAGEERDEEHAGSGAPESGWSPLDVYEEGDGGEEEAAVEPGGPEEPEAGPDGGADEPWAEQADPWTAESSVEPQQEAIPAAEPVSEPVTREPLAGELAAEDEGRETEEPEAAGSGGAGEEVASLLDRMARRIREEGPEAVRREMESDDRLTSLLAGLLAGYLTGRE